MGRPRVLPRFLRSTSVRLSVRFALLYAVLTSLIFAAAYVMAEEETTEWVGEQLTAEEAALARIYHKDGLDAVVAQLTNLAAFNFESHRVYLLTDEAGARIAGNVKRIDWDGSIASVSASKIELDGDRGKEAIGYVLREIKLGPNTLILGTSTYFLEELLEGFGTALAGGLILILMIGAAFGVAVGRRTERRLLEVSTALKQAAQGNLEARVPATPGDTGDLSRLGQEINRTIAQLQQLVDGQNQISADIAHDLRTPMQRLRQRLEAIGRSPDLSPDLGSEVDEAIGAADDLIDTFHALLRISQIEAGARREKFGRVDLAAILTRIEDAYSAVAEENGQTLVFRVDDKTPPVLGDQQLLTQMMANVVENAMRHCPEGTRVEVTLQSGENGARFRVADNGAGIPEPDREKVFRRFYRVEKSRTTPGNGLGLSLVKAVADLHGAQASLADNTPGLIVTIEFLAADTPES